MPPLSIQSNVSALQTQRQLGQTTKELAASFTRLSSGLRITRASDDAAGLSIATSLSTDVRVFTQGVRNLNDGVSALSIAQGALNELRDIVIRQNELAEQAANGIYSLKQRKPLDQEANALVEEFNRIVRTTEFNGQKLIDNSLTSMRMQAGYGTAGSLTVSIGSQFAHAVGTGSFQSSVSYVTGSTNNIDTADFNGDGIVDVVGGSVGVAAVFLGNGDGSFKAAVGYGTGSAATGMVTGDFNGDGIADIAKTDEGTGEVGILIGNGNGSFKAQVNYLSGLPAPRWMNSADLNGDGTPDLLVTSNTGGGNTLTLMFANSNGTFRAPTVINTGSFSAENAAFGDVNGDGILDFAISDYNSNTVSVFIGNGNGTFRARISSSVGLEPSGVILKDFNRDGILDFGNSNFGDSTWGFSLGNGNGTFKAYQTLATGAGPSDIQGADINEDGYQDVVIGENGLDGVRVFFGNANGTFQSGIFTTNGNNAEDVVLVDVNADGALDVLASNYTLGGFTSMISATQNVSTVSYLDLLTQSTARQTLVTGKQRLTRITSELGAIGSYESRFQSALNTLQITRENYASATSQIMDVDVATETADLARRRILQQAGVSVLAQANQEPRLALRLLGA